MITFRISALSVTVSHVYIHHGDPSIEGNYCILGALLLVAAGPGSYLSLGICLQAPCAIFQAGAPRWLGSSACDLSITEGRTRHALRAEVLERQSQNRECNDFSKSVLKTRMRGHPVSQNVSVSLKLRGCALC